MTSPATDPSEEFYGWQAKGYERGIFVEEDAGAAQISTAPPGLPDVIPGPDADDENDAPGRAPDGPARAAGTDAPD